MKQHKNHRIYDNDQAVFEWLRQNAEHSDHWMYQPGHPRELPAKITIFDSELLVLFMVRWGGRLVNIVFDDIGRRNGYR